MCRLAAQGVTMAAWAGQSTTRTPSQVPCRGLLSTTVGKHFSPGGGGGGVNHLNPSLDTLRFLMCFLLA